MVQNKQEGSIIFAIMAYISVASVIRISTKPNAPIIPTTILA
jgi:hypothetical protein